MIMRDGVVVAILDHVSLGETDKLLGDIVGMWNSNRITEHGHTSTTRRGHEGFQEKIYGDITN